MASPRNSRRSIELVTWNFNSSVDHVCVRSSWLPPHLVLGVAAVRERLQQETALPEPVLDRRLHLADVDLLQQVLRAGGSHVQVDAGRIGRLCGKGSSSSFCVKPR